METPPESLGPFVADPVRGPEESVPDAQERETVRFLRREVLPALRRANRSALLRPVERVVATGHVSGLGRLPERTRREFLEYLETGVPRARQYPRALVALTSTVAQLPAPHGGRERRLASPAR
ncbi:MAG TPA: hypothetical protein VEY07_00050 [Thermoplasmata archaeon]|nr:hypothetical protein [Thermoplasmata archaeon]